MVLTRENLFDLTDAIMPVRIQPPAITPGITSKRNLNSVRGTRGLGQDYAIDPVTGDVTLTDPSAPTAPPTGPDYSIFTGGVPTATPAPLYGGQSLYVAPSGMSAQDAAANAAANLPAGATAVVQNNDGTTSNVVAVASPPANPDMNTWYKVVAGGVATLMKATGQYNAQGQPLYNSYPVSSMSPMVVYAGLGLAAFFLVSGKKRKRR